MDAFCPVYNSGWLVVVCAGDIFLAHFGPQLSIALNTTAYLNIGADYIDPLLITVFPFSDGFFQQDKTP